MSKKLGRLSLFVAVTLFFLFAFPNPTLAQTPLFNPQTEYAAGAKNGPSGIAVADFNGDGKPDLAVVNFGDWTAWLLLGWYIAEGDFNGDGKADLVITNYGDNSVSVLLGNGDGTFQAPKTFPVGIHPGLVAVGDFNRDGKPDLAVSNVDSGTVSVLLGNGDGTFLPALDFPVGPNPWYFTVGDFNGDGILDLAVSDYGCSLDCNTSPSNTVTVLLGNGDGTFRPAPSLTVGNGPAGVTVGDFNGDGKLDLAVANVNENTLSVLLGNGDGTFQAPHTFADPGMTHPYFVAVGDFNGDGKPDLVVTNHLFTTTSMLLGNGDGTFQPAQDFPVDSDPVFVTVGDFNGDRKPDLAVANLHSLNISVLLGNGGSSTVAATPTFSPGGGTYTGSVTVTISDATSGATIYYTTDGSTPTTSSAVYTGALTFTQTTTLKAMAAANGMTNSAVASATYTIQQQSFTLSVNKTDLGSGTVTSSPAGINCGSNCSASYVSGTTVTLTATPDLLSGFGGWSGCDSVSGNTCTVDMNSARSVTADFRLLGLL